MSGELVAAMVELVEQALVPLRERIERQDAEIAALRAELGAGQGDEPVGLEEARRIAGVSKSTMYQHAQRYGGWKVDPSKPKSEWRFDRDLVRQVRDAAAVRPVELDVQRRRPRATSAPLLPVKDRAA